jgi:hypothetical protein
MIGKPHMPSYRIHRLKDHLRQSFRFAPHVSGTAAIKPRDYEPAESIQAASPYAAFFCLREGASPLEVGDLLEAEDGSIRICKFVGFEEARWVVPETLLPHEPSPETTPPERAPETSAQRA